MAVSYPDVIGNYLKPGLRFETGGLQYAGYFEPSGIAPGQVAHLYLFLQNTLNVPLAVNFQIEVPKAGGFLRSKHPLLEVKNPALAVELSQGEAGLLTVPVTTTSHTVPGKLPLTIVPKITSKNRGKRVRPVQSTSNLGTGLIESPMGLNLVSSLGATYSEKSVKKAAFNLTVAGKPEPLQRAPKLEHSYESIWIEKDLNLLNRAVQELNERQVKIKDDLNVEQLYVNMYGEAVGRFADAGLPMRIGEAIVMAKMLTYSCHYFLSSPKRANGLLVPIWERALDERVDTTDTLHVIRSVGFHHIIRLAVATSFSVISKVFKRQYWPLDERLAVGNHIADHLETGQSLDLEFLYLPLLMGGTQIANKVRLQGEDIDHTLALIKRAREARTRLFVDQDMEKADKIYRRILNRVAA